MQYLRPYSKRGEGKRIPGIVRYCMWLICFLPGFVQAQTLTDTLQEQKVKAQRERKISNDDKVNRFAPGQKVIAIDSATKQLYEQQSLAQLLSRQVPVFVKSYGFNGLSTLNFRGSSAAQSQVYWNGVPLQNAALGIADVSLLAVSFADKINVVYGSSSALWGSGNVGGAVLLENDPPAFGTGYRAAASVGGGSFGQYSAQARAGFSGKKVAITLRGLYQSAANDFSYTDAEGRRQNMPNSRLNGTAVMGNMGWQAGKDQVLSLSLWWQRYERQIPPALFEALSVKKQDDASLRLLLDWTLKKENGSWYAKSAFLHDQMNYTDAAISLYSENGTRQYFQELGYKRSWGKNHLQVFTPLHLSWLTDQTGARKTQTKAALALAFSRSMLHDRVKLALNLRDEQVNSRNEFLPGASASWQVLPWLRLRGNVQRTFRAPTLNELYYEPGGNSALRPERGWTQELGYGVRAGYGGWRLEHELSYFNRSIRDWIIWYGGAIWTPHNIATVHSRGVETENRLHWQRGPWSAVLGVNTSYVLATTTKSDAPNDGSIGRQIPYTPRYQVQGSLGIGYRNWYLNYDHVYAGYRFVTTDESQYLEPYQSGNLSLRYAGQWRRQGWRLMLQCFNITDERYGVVAFRPMPGRYWQGSIAWDLKP